MNTHLLILLSLLSISVAYAHPNHMTFEDVQHNSMQIKNTFNASDKINHIAVEEKQGHSDTVPCIEQQQHKSVPCKKK